MDLYASIARRKSCREYDPSPLGQELLGEIENAIQGFEPLYPDVPLRWRFTGRVKGSFHVEAPHYLIIGGQGVPGELENVGFVFGQLALWFDAMELGSVWLGKSRDAEAKDTRGDIIAMAFGRAAGPVHRSLGQFRRRPIDEITNAPDDVCIRAAHLAPSGMNTQPWYFEKRDDGVRVYKRRLKPPVSLLYGHSDIDMGIALCHYALACRETGRPFRFARSEAPAGRAGYLPVGIIG